LAVDLHTHSNASDGTDTPEEVVRRAAEAGLTAVALTDHDTLAGIGAARSAAVELGIDLIPGVELSVNHGEVKLHMLAYFVEPAPGPLQDELEGLRAGRDDRNPAIVEKLCRLGLPITMEDVEEQAGGESIGRPHIADALVAAGHLTSREQGFDGLLDDRGLAYVERRRLDAVAAIGLAHESGGVTSVAHPYTAEVDAPGLRRMMGELADAGLDGIETRHSEHSELQQRAYGGLAAELGLVATGGSDYHGTGKPAISVGKGKGDLQVDDAALDALRERRSAIGDR
jgi:predicted metal-dependent phosphoesterase TrpH